jgi:hypothetical protein
MVSALAVTIFAKRCDSAVIVWFFREDYAKRSKIPFD